ncbi:Crp/Fnr family transcriptional regulator [Marinobacter lacisalsi]|uniref:Crp/Fnr family transcriptional regulator n=1 Tax=Marinobacter lacisalsi TaxID=475979 RepID=A0ABV8QFT0_9GAMM
MKARSGEAQASERVDPFSICRISSSVKELDKSGVLFMEGDPAQHVYVVKSGLCFSFRYHEDGRRQIIDLAFPGDFVGLEALTQEQFVSGLSALTPAELVAYPVDDFTQRCYAEAALSRTLVECIAREQVILTKRLVGVAHSSASQRIAHFLLEVRVRALTASELHPVGAGAENHCLLSDCGAFTLNLPQAVIADTLGLSIVHVSRTLSKLKDDGLIEDSPAGLRYMNVDGLKAVAQWEGLAPWFEAS